MAHIKVTLLELISLLDIMRSAIVALIIRQSWQASVPGDRSKHGLQVRECLFDAWYQHHCDASNIRNISPKWLSSLSNVYSPNFFRSKKEDTIPSSMGPFPHTEHYQCMYHCLRYRNWYEFDYIARRQKHFQISLEYLVTFNMHSLACICCTPHHAHTMLLAFTYSIISIHLLCL